MHTLPARFATDVDPGDAVLLLCPPFEPVGPAACVDLLTVDAPAATQVLSIIYTPTPRDRVTLCTEHADTHPADATIINVDVDARSAQSLATGDDTADSYPALTIERVSSPADLTGIGVAVTTQLDAWDAQSADHQIVGCFHSITALLQYVGLDRAFTFLDALTTQFAAADAITHYHMDPAAHDSQTISRLASLFDAVVEYDQPDWTVTTR